MKNTINNTAAEVQTITETASTANVPYPVMKQPKTRQTRKSSKEEKSSKEPKAPSPDKTFQATDYKFLVRKFTEEAVSVICKRNFVAFLKLERHEQANYVLRDNADEFHRYLYWKLGVRANSPLAPCMLHLAEMHVHTLFHN